MSEDNKKPDAAPSVAENAAPATEIKTETVAMAQVESPPLAPLIEEPAKPEVTPEIKVEARGPEAAAPAAPKFPGFAFPKFPPLGELAQQHGLAAAGIAIAIIAGTVIGAVAVTPKHEPVDIVAAATAAQDRQERDALQKTIQKMNQEMASLRANIDSQAKATSAQIGKLTERLKDNDRVAEARRAAAQSDITGSISAPASIPVPQPRPAAAALKTAVVDGWNIRSARDGLVLVEGRGEIFEVVPGAPLPGLGVVEDVRRENGRWVVVTAKGLIVASNRPRGPAYDRY